jgi:hypothetical protein
MSSNTQSKYLRLTLLKVKPLNQTEVPNIKLKFDFQKQNQQTDFFPGKEINPGKVKFIKIKYLRATFLK